MAVLCAAALYKKKKAKKPGSTCKSENSKEFSYPHNCSTHQLREMPSEWLLPAAMAVRVELEISVVEQDRDLVLGLLQECLLSREEECWVSSHLCEGRLPLELLSFPY